MTLEEIKAAVESGKRVFWANSNYEVKKLPNGWEICCTNGTSIGLVWADEVTMNGRPEDFYIEGSR